MSTVVAFEPFSCGKIRKYRAHSNPSNNKPNSEKTATYVHSDAGELKDLGGRILAWCVAVEFHLAAVKLNGIQGRLHQLVIAPQGHRLTPSHRRRLHQQIYVTQRGLAKICKGVEIYSKGCSAMKVECL